MTRTVIFHSDKFDVVSYGNGLSYAVHDNVNKVSAFVQGNDAVEFRDEFETWPGDYDLFCAEQIAIRE